MATDPNATAAIRIREMRTCRGWSQEELAARCGLHRTYIGAVERTERNITLRTLARIADALGCDLVDLISPTHRKAKT